MKKVPLNKYIAHAGISSRRKAVDLIKEGKVAVNKTIVKDPAHLVCESDAITINGQPIAVEKRVVVLLNKPRGYVTTTSDEMGRKTVLDLIGSSVKQRLYPIGRLDLNTTGVLLLTNDGEIAQRLAHPKHQVKKAYHVTLDKPLHERDREAIISGVKLEDGKVVIDRVSFPLGPKKNQIRITLHSGKYRVVRRLFEALGYNVKRLDRIQYAHFTKKGMPVGVWRKLGKKEIDDLKRMIGLE